MSEQAYVVSIGRSAQKEIRALDGVLRTRIVQSIRSLELEPRPHGCRKLVGQQIVGGFELVIIA